MAKCDRCNGTGWASAARDSGMEDMPVMLRPLGVYRCHNCNGGGDLDKAIKSAWEKVVAHRTAERPTQRES